MRRLRKTGSLLSFWWENYKFWCNFGSVPCRLKVLYFCKMIAISPFIWHCILMTFILIYVFTTVDALNEKEYEKAKENFQQSSGNLFFEVSISK